MKKHIYKVMNGILKFINNIMPKDDKKILFHSVPDFSDNSQAFYEFVKEKKIMNVYG